MGTQRYSDTYLLQLIKDFHSQHDRLPSTTDLAIPASTFHRRFGSWKDSIKKAGFEPTNMHLPPLTLICKQCDTSFKRWRSEAKKSENHFCTRSCAATYNNQHKKHGTRRSKLESWLETQLKDLYPDLEIQFNQKDAINSELDIFLPSLNLAFELNGIFHYEPIYGPDKLKQIKNNDTRKFQACLEQGIELCILDTSQLTYSVPRHMNKYLHIVTQIIETKSRPM